MKLKFDLENESETETKPLDEDIPTLSEENKTEDLKFDVYMLPIKIVDGDGNFSYQMKNLDNVTIDEFKSWMWEVLPLGEETIEKFMGINKSRNKNAFQNLKTRKEIFNAVVKMHEMRWLFGRGKENLPKDLGSN